MDRGTGSSSGYASRLILLSWWTLACLPIRFGTLSLARLGDGAECVVCLGLGWSLGETAAFTLPTGSRRGFRVVVAVAGSGPVATGS